jgi:uncharacterized protein (DUF952 family)
MILHLVAKADWDAQAAQQVYAAPSLQSEGFIHCSGDARTLLNVANAFYAAQPGPFVVLYIDEGALRSPLKWEAPAHPKTEPAPAQQSAAEHPAPAATTAPEAQAEFGVASAASQVAAPEAPPAAPEFPHVYGPIDRAAIIAVRLIRRDADGRFLGIGEPVTMPVAAPAATAAPQAASASDPENPMNLKTPSQMAGELLDATDGFSDALKRYRDQVESRMDQLDDEIKKKLG